MFGLIKKIFIGLLTGLVNGSNHTKCTSLSNQKCMTQPSIINLHPNEYSQEFHYYPFAVKLDRCVRSCNTLNNLSNKVCIPNKQWNNDKCRCECKKRYIFVKEHVWNPAIYNCEKGYG